jgi:hypothetical protein
MKKLIIVLLILSTSFLAQAGELNEANLQGSWLILTMNGQSDDANDKWETMDSKSRSLLKGLRDGPGRKKYGR